MLRATHYIKAGRVRVEVPLTEGGVKAARDAAEGDASAVRRSASGERCRQTLRRSSSGRTAAAGASASVHRPIRKSRCCREWAPRPLGGSRSTPSPTRPCARAARPRRCRSSRAKRRRARPRARRRPSCRKRHAGPLASRGAAAWTSRCRRSRQVVVVQNAALGQARPLPPRWCALGRRLPCPLVASCAPVCATPPPLSRVRGLS